MFVLGEMVDVELGVIRGEGRSSNVGGSVGYGEICYKRGLSWGLLSDSLRSSKRIGKMGRYVDFRGLEWSLVKRS